MYHLTFTVEDRPREIPDPKEYREVCKGPVAYLLLGVTAAGLGVVAALACFDGARSGKPALDDVLTLGGLPTIVGSGKPVSCFIFAHS